MLHRVDVVSLYVSWNVVSPLSKNVAADLNEIYYITITEHILTYSARYIVNGPD
jgi:hypothetical protein